MTWIHGSSWSICGMLSSRTVCQTSTVTSNKTIKLILWQWQVMTHWPITAWLWKGTRASESLLMYWQASKNNMNGKHCNKQQLDTEKQLHLHISSSLLPVLYRTETWDLMQLYGNNTVLPKEFCLNHLHETKRIKHDHIQFSTWRIWSHDSTLLIMSFIWWRLSSVTTHWMGLHIQ